MEEDVAGTDGGAAVGHEHGVPISRRNTFRLAAAMFALGRSLGLPSGLVAAETPARVEIKYYRTPANGDAQLLYAEPLASPVLEALSAGDISEIEIRWYDGRASLLGTVRLPAELQQKLKRLRNP